MINENNKKLFLDFLIEYLVFFNKMVEVEHQKLDALLSNELPRIEHIISLAQATSKELENMENNRMILQEKAGFGGMTFSEILENLEDEEKEEFSNIFQKLQTCISEVKHYNIKSIDIAKTNIMRINPSNPFSALKNQTTAPNGYTKEQATAQKKGSILQTKV